MADIELVIKIPEEKYQEVVNGRWRYGLLGVLCAGVANGTPIPKGHGDLIDKKVAYKKFYSRCLAKVATEVFAEIPTIIEADRKEQK